MIICHHEISGDQEARAGKIWPSYPDDCLRKIEQYLKRANVAQCIFSNDFLSNALIGFLSMPAADGAGYDGLRSKSVSPKHVVQKIGVIPTA